MELTIESIFKAWLSEAENAQTAHTELSDLSARLGELDEKLRLAEQEKYEIIETDNEKPRVVTLKTLQEEMVAEESLSFIAEGKTIDERKLKLIQHVKEVNPLYDAYMQRIECSNFESKRLSSEIKSLERQFTAVQKKNMIFSNSLHGMEKFIGYLTAERETAANIELQHIVTAINSHVDEIEKGQNVLIARLDRIENEIKKDRDSKRQLLETLL